MAARPIADGLFTEDERPQLLAARCADCSSVTFPAPHGCPRCTGRALVEHRLPAEGVLWSWTVQRFEPKKPYRGPDAFEPYGVGYIEFPGECIVESRLTTADTRQLEIGAPVRMTLVQAYRDDEGAAVLTYAFEPKERPA